MGWNKFKSSVTKSVTSGGRLLRRKSGEKGGNGLSAFCRFSPFRGRVRFLSRFSLRWRGAGLNTLRRVRPLLVGPLGPRGLAVHSALIIIKVIYPPRIAKFFQKVKVFKHDEWAGNYSKGSAADLLHFKKGLSYFNALIKTIKSDEIWLHSGLNDWVLFKTILIQYYVFN